MPDGQNWRALLDRISPELIVEVACGVFSDPKDVLQQRIDLAAAAGETDLLQKFEDALEILNTKGCSNTFTSSQSFVSGLINKNSRRLDR